MKEEDYLRGLEEDDFDMFPGQLANVKQHAPPELHFRVMQQIRSEQKKKPFFTFKRYTSLAAAAVLLFAAIGGGQMLYAGNQEKAPQRLTATVQKKAVAMGEEKKQDSSKVQPAVKQPVMKKNTADIQKPVTAKANKKETHKVLVAANTNDVSITASKKKVIDNQAAVAMKDMPQLSISAKAPVASNNNSSKLPDSSQAAGSSTDKVAADNNSGSTDNTQASADNVRIAALESDNTVNYEIDLNMGQTYIIQFVKERGLKLDDGVYKLKASDYEKLSGMLSDGGVTQKLMEKPSDSDFVVIKMSIN